MKDEALKLALEALERLICLAEHEGWERLDKEYAVISTIKQALAAPVQNGGVGGCAMCGAAYEDQVIKAPVQGPVATVVRPGKGWNVWLSRLVEPGTTLYIVPPNVATPLAAQRQWVGLSDEQINAFFEGMEPNNGFWLSFARAIEAKLKEKNTP